MIPSAVLDTNAAAAFQSARNLRKIMSGEEIEGLDRVTALETFQNNFGLFLANSRALSEVMYGVGNALRLFDVRNRLQFGDARTLFGNFNQQLASFGGTEAFANQLADKTKAAREEFEQHYGPLLDKIRKGEEWDEFLSFSGREERLTDTNIEQVPCAPAFVSGISGVTHKNDSGFN